MTTPLRIVEPLALTDSKLVSSDVPETDHAAWSSATTYALGAFVILTSTHRIYQSLQASNTNKNPATEPLWWADIGPTNRWAAWDTSNSTQTAQATSISYRVTPGQAVTAVAALNLVGASSVRVRVIDPTYGTVYDKTVDVTSLPTSPAWWAWFFGSRSIPTVALLLDLPAYPNADIRIDLAGGASLAVGVIVVGQAKEVGVAVERGARLGITDYSRKETNQYGDAVLVQRAYAKRASFSMRLPRDDVDSVINLLSYLRAVPALWIGSEAYGSSVVYGFYKTFDITIAYALFSDCNLEIEGLT